MGIGEEILEFSVAGVVVIDDVARALLEEPRNYRHRLKVFSKQSKARSCYGNLM